MDTLLFNCAWLSGLRCPAATAAGNNTGDGWFRSSRENRTKNRLRSLKFSSIFASRMLVLRTAVPEAKCLVAAAVEPRNIDRASGTGAELVPFETRQRVAVEIGIKAIGVQIGVAQEFEQAPVKMVGAGLIDHVDNAAPAASELGGIG